MLTIGSIRKLEQLGASWFNSNFNVAMIDQAMVSGINFCANLTLARYLGISEFGKFTLGWMAVLIANSLQEGFIISPMMSIGPTVPPIERPHYFATILCHQAALAVAASCLLFVVIAASGVCFPEWRVRGIALPLAVAAAAHLVQEFIRRFLYTVGLARTALAIDAVGYFGRLGGLVFMLSLGTLDAAVALWIIAAAATASLALGFKRYEAIRFNRAALRAISLRHWRFGRWLGASAVVFWMCNNFFIFSAGGILGAWAVGAIKAAQDIMGVTNIVYQGLYNVVIVGAAERLKSGGACALQAYLRRVAILGGLAVAAIGVVASVAPSLWLGLIYGPQYSAYGGLVQWYAVAYLIGFMHLPLRVGLYVTENTVVVFWGYLAVGTFSLLAAYPLIHTFALNGAMFGPVAAEVIMCSLLFVLLRRRLSDSSGESFLSVGGTAR